MLRTIISLDMQDKNWITRQAKKEKISQTELIRRAIKAYRKKIDEKSKSAQFNELLDKTQGILQIEDGLKYQTKLRDEWE